ncbi:Nitroreductase NfnB [compost metagenome]
MNIARDDEGGRNAAFMRNFVFFDAPHVAFFYLPAGFGLREAADLGMCAQTFMLALTAKGIASCPQTALSFSAEQVRDAVGASAGEILLFGISFGYEDPTVAANGARTGRAPREASFTFVG